MKLARATAHRTDIIVGGRLRTRREELQLTQAALAHLVGISPQQVQKYECGQNRISASTLLELAEALALPISVFFQGLPSYTEPDDDLRAFIATSEGSEVARIWPTLSIQRRQQLLQLMQTMEWAP